MPNNSVKDIRGVGTMRQKAASSAGPADTFSSSNAVAPDDILEETQNNYVPVRRTYGDGRQYTPIQMACPGCTTPGQFWIETVLGVDYWVFVDSTGTPQYMSPSGSGIIPTPTVIALPNGTPTVIEMVLADSVGLVEWSAAIYNPTVGYRTHFRLVAAHNGTGLLDATVAQLNQASTVSIGTLPVTLDVQITGSGVGQTMDLVATATEIGWYTASIVERLVVTTSSPSLTPSRM